MSPHSVSGQFTPTDAPLSGSLPSISSPYSIATLPNNYSDQTTYLPPSTYHHHRSNSTSDYDSPRSYKRPRANTSNAATTLYSQHEAASLLGEMSRSYSDHGSSTRLPSLAESYVQTTPLPPANEQQATPGMNQNQMSSRGSYDFTSYIDANAGGGGMQGEGTQEEVIREEEG